MSSLDIVPREESERRLAAILVPDVVGYSRLMQADEEGTADGWKPVVTSQAALTAPCLCGTRVSIGQRFGSTVIRTHFTISGRL